MKKVLSFMLVFVLLFSVVGCSNTEPAEEQAEENASEEVTVKEASANEGDTLVVWTFTDELKGIIKTTMLQIMILTMKLM